VVAQVPLENWGTPAKGVSSYVDPPVAEARPLASVDQYVSSADQMVNAGPDLSQPLSEDVASCRGVYFQADGLYWGRVGTGCDQVLVIDTL
jgi:hypothetical protein